MDLILGRLRRGDDLVAGIEALAREHGLTRAVVRCGPGSLDAGCVQAGGAPTDIPGPGPRQQAAIGPRRPQQLLDEGLAAAELLVLYGEVGPDGASLHGVVADPDARIYAGRFLRGRNPVCITVEVALEPMG